MNVTRRALLRTTALTPVAFVLAACGTTGSALSAFLTPAAVDAVQGIGQYFEQQFLPTIENSGVKLSSSTSATINKIVGAISGAASGISTATTQSQGASVLATIENYVNALVPVAEPILAGIPGAGPILTIAVAALPEAEVLLNMGVSLLSPLAQQIAAQPVPTTPTAAARSLTPSEALAKVLAATGR